jgi:ankyrin repeat protein
MNGHLAVVAYLSEQGVDINERDNEGKTPLSWAKRHAEIVDFLEQRGAVQ